MSSKVLNKSKIHKILVVSLTNIGDVILTLPVIDVLKVQFPLAKMSLVVGPKAESLFHHNPHFENFYIYDKRQSLMKTLSWVKELRKQRFDLVVDLRNSAIPFLLSSRYRTSFIDKKDETCHMKDKHLDRLKQIIDFSIRDNSSKALVVPEKDKAYVSQLLSEEKLKSKCFVVISAGAANHAKRWTIQSFAQLCDYLVHTCRVAVAFVGDDQDREVTEKIVQNMIVPSSNFCGKTTLIQLAEILQQSFFVISNDSAPMHLASYLNIPVLAIFGPSNPQKYGPWSQNCYLLSSRNIFPGKSVAVQEGISDAIENVKVEAVIDSFVISDHTVVFQKT